MFERYTEKARRIIFFARYEASQFGSPYIESEHLLLGILREDKTLTNRFLPAHAIVESIRKQIEANSTIREKVSTSVDLPLSNECKRVLAYAAEEAERMSNKHIGAEHLFLGLMREKDCSAATILKERGLNIVEIRESLASNPHKPATGRSSDAVSQREFSRDLTQAAADGTQNPIFGRDEEIEAVIEVLCACEKNNPLLLGERGVGKTAIVEGLAQRIANGEIPASMAEKRILLFDLQLLSSAANVGETPEESVSIIARILGRDKSRERLKNAVKSMEDIPEGILFIDDLPALFAASSRLGSSVDLEILKPALREGKLCCIGASTPDEYQALTAANPWLADCFRIVHVRAMDEENTLRVLEARKERYERFHGVSYSPEALESAAKNAGRYLPDRSLPGKALELMDAAGTRAKLRQAAPPVEIAEAVKRIKFIGKRMAESIANHEFEKARFFSNEERKEKENLRALKERYRLDDSAPILVGRGDIEEVINRWTAYPFCP